MILLLATLTYARLETYRSFTIMQNQFNQYMSKAERSTINNTAQTLYDSNIATQMPGKGTQQKGKKQALSRLSFSAFVDSKMRESYAQEYPQLHTLAVRLIQTLYKDQRFYREMEQKRPDFVNALLAALQHAENLPAENLSRANATKPQKIARAADLANLNLQDPDLNDAFYKMLQGTMTPREKPDQQGGTFGADQKIVCQSPGELGEEDDEGIEPGKQEEVRSPQGYYSLLDFITIQDAGKVRVFLAARPLLMAIFDDPAVVTALLETRCMLYNNVVHGTMTPDQAAQALRTQFLPHSKGFDEIILDFSVTKTNPRNYE